MASRSYLDAVTFFTYHPIQARDTFGAMRKLAVAALALAMVWTVPAFAKHPKVKHPQNAHPTNPYLKHPNHKAHRGHHKKI